jgi:myo-inositol-1(or 4)-monophosphatase
MNMESGKLDDLLLQLRPFVLKTAAFLREENARFSRKMVEEKGLNNLVSWVDKEAEKQLVEACSSILPEAGFITEEGTVGASQKEDSLLWIIDPLDGTTNFVHRLPEYSISVGLVCKGEPVLGMIAHADRDKLYYARKGGGAWCNGQQLFNSSESKLSGSLLATGFPYYDFDHMPQYLEVLHHFMKNTHGLRRMGSAAIDLAYVAEGVFEGFFEYNLNPWDVAAGICLVREAGGLVTDFRGENNALFGRQIIAAGPAVHAAMLEIIRNRWELR